MKNSRLAHRGHDTDLDAPGVQAEGLPGLDNPGRVDELLQTVPGQDCREPRWRDAPSLAFVAGIDGTTAGGIADPTEPQWRHLHPVACQPVPRVGGGPVDVHLEVQVRPEAVTGVALGAERRPGCHARPDRQGGHGHQVEVAVHHAAAGVDVDVVAAAAGCAV